MGCCTTLRSGRSLKSQPEKLRRHLLSAVLRTSSCTNAPVSWTFSQGAEVSQAWSRTMASPTRKASPGFIVRSVVMPLRLLSRPITATRSAIGVPGRASAPPLRIFCPSIFTGPVRFSVGSSLSPQAASDSSNAKGRVGRIAPAGRGVMMRLGSTLHSRRLRADAAHPSRARRWGGRHWACQSRWA